MGYAGGKNRTDIFRVKIVGGAYVVKQVGGTTTATSATHKSLRLAESVKVDKPRKGKTLGMTFDQDMGNAAFEILIKACVTDASSSSSIVVGQRVYSNGDTAFGDAGSAGGELVLAINYGAVTSEGVKVTATLGNISEDSGSESEEATNSSKPKFQINGVKADYSLDVKPFIDGAIVTAPTTMSIDAGYGYTIAFAAAI